jgi:thiamine pyrophosphokinase
MPAEECFFAFKPPPPSGGFVLHALVFANGELQAPVDWQVRAATADLIIAADGGAAHCHTLGLLPDVLIGDLDSLSPALRSELEARRVRFLMHPAQKDQTDFELAVLHAKEASANKVTVLAGLGRRWDHSLANLLLAAQSQFSELQITFLQGEQRLHILRGANKLAAKAGERVSLLPLGGDADGVTTSGLMYPLEHEILKRGSSRGVSNVAEIDFPEVTSLQGMLLCVISPLELD